MTAAAAGHVALHRLHPLAGLDGDPTRVKGDALAHQSERGCSTTNASSMPEDDELRRVRASLGDSEQSAHSQAPHRVLIQRLDPHAVLPGHVPRSGSQLSRGEDIGRLIDEIACQVGRSRHNLAPSNGALEWPRRFTVHAKQRERFDVTAALFAFLPFVGVESVQAERGPLRDGLGDRLGCESSPVCVIDSDRDAPRPTGTEMAKRLGCSLSNTILGEFRGLPETKKQGLLDTESSGGAQKVPF